MGGSASASVEAIGPADSRPSGLSWRRPACKSWSSCYAQSLATRHRPDSAYRTDRYRLLAQCSAFV